MQVLKNKLQYFEIPFHSQNFILSLYINAGVLYETKENIGISHFVEHLFEDNFQQKQDDLPEYRDFSTYDHTIVITFHAPRKHFMFYLKNIIEALQNPSFTPQDVERERKIILDEYNQDSPDREPLYKIYKKTPIGYSPLGTQETIHTLSYEDLRDWHQKIFTPTNIVIGYAGEKDYAGELQSRLQEITSSKLPPTPISLQDIPRPKPIIQSPSSQKERQISLYFPVYHANPYLLEYAYKYLQKILFELGENQGMYNLSLERNTYNEVFQIWEVSCGLSSSKEEKQFLSLLQTQIKASIDAFPQNWGALRERILFQLHSMETDLFQAMDFQGRMILKGFGDNFNEYQKQYESVTGEDVQVFLLQSDITNPIIYSVPR